MNKKKDEGQLSDPEEIMPQNPAKFDRCNAGQFDLARCYYENTSKEELVLEHVLEYKR
jgi:hypothetical protein